ncbi:hypothetical protein [Acinetobacter sp.]|uniref:hypothetical protein n=1 Tax=Acinetobacter sp. TaxID=472 RepID=UPI0028B135B8|nr:hypothetical protein [Acinetobacter sp.]
MDLNKILVTFLTLIIVNSSLLADVKVNGYYRKDGTYVRPYYRSNPDGNFNNNWSTIGNVNPYTGKIGTKIENPTQHPTYRPSTIKDLNIPHTTTYSSINSLPKQNPSAFFHSASQTTTQPYIANTTQKFKKTEHPSSTHNLSSLEMLELESRIRSSERLKGLGYTGNTSDLSLIDMMDLESRIRVSQRLKGLGYTGNTSDLSLIDMMDLESKIRSSERLNKLGY